MHTATLATSMVANVLLGGNLVAEDVAMSRTYYGAKLEPIDRVLHGAGQCAGRHVINYTKATAPHAPILYMDYCGLRDDNAEKWVLGLIGTLNGLQGFVVPQIGMSMTVDGQPEKHYEQEVAMGKHDDAIKQRLKSLKEIGRPMYLRIGYEFNGSWNGYQPDTYRSAFRRVANMVRGENLNAATIWCAAPGKLDDIMTFYPGDDAVDWWGIDVFMISDIANITNFINEAAKHNKPVMIGESTPMRIGVTEGRTSWDKWYAPYFKMIRSSQNVKAFCYINWNWSDYKQWNNWGDARIEVNEVISKLYRQEMGNSIYAHSGTEADFMRLFEE